MKRIGIRALKENASAVVAQVAVGETVTITDRGRPVALLTPYHASPLERLRASGQLRPAKHDSRSLPPPLPNTTGVSVSDALAQTREDRF